MERLRPNWLRNRGLPPFVRARPTYPLVYIDEVRSGGLETLNRVSSQIIREVRYINGRDCTTKWGLDHGGGVILILPAVSAPRIAVRIGSDSVSRRSLLSQSD